MGLGKEHLVSNLLDQGSQSVPFLGDQGERRSFASFQECGRVWRGHRPTRQTISKNGWNEGQYVCNLPCRPQELC
jgi:hypothetical protein